jgi:coproporphyrinogen III oxidase-like Fe-S oxidoreductase
MVCTPLRNAADTRSPVRYDGELIARYGGVLHRRTFLRLEPLLQDGLVELGEERIAITPAGRLLLRSIAMVFDRYIATAQNERFSRAI